MSRLLTTTLTTLLLTTTTLLTPPQAAADPEDCIRHALTEADAGILAADLACNAPTFLACYRGFRAEYGPQLWAIRACELR
ncbi:hypothetical protein JOF53_005692 [Crossiella equi]|uniref:Uncharacterized protein n=1 Tax=Crossiella equi TaxID=130796 RepID=A0ABS5AJS6_9PSEU|nr:hypothetical protein [Crossiella equi]MBP2476820.1 hypothetical protein [Crossiella equi]